MEIGAELVRIGRTTKIKRVVILSTIILVWTKGSANGSASKMIHRTENAVLRVLAMILVKTSATPSMVADTDGIKGQCSAMPRDHMIPV
jgi:hypothetical protein